AHGAARRTLDCAAGTQQPIPPRFPRRQRLELLVLSYVSNLDVPFERYFGGTRQPNIVPRAFPVYAQLATTHFDLHSGVEQPTHSLHSNRRACSRSACERLS